MNNKWILRNGGYLYTILNNKVKMYNEGELQKFEIKHHISWVLRYMDNNDDRRPTRYRLIKSFMDAFYVKFTASSVGISKAWTTTTSISLQALCLCYYLWWQNLK